jgi:hypothetical protein
MICQRCGTEHQSPDKICPRCFYGRPKEKISLSPKARWLLGLGAPVLVALIVFAAIFIPRIGRLDDRWLDGVWQGENLALILKVEDHSFQLINGENVLYGEFVLDSDYDLRLIAEDGQNYVYNYTLKDPNTMTVSFADGLYIVRETLTRMGAETEEEESEEGPEFTMDE